MQPFPATAPPPPAHPWRPEPSKDTIHHFCSILASICSPSPHTLSLCVRVCSYEFFWAQDGKKPIKVSAPHYTELLRSWIIGSLQNDQLVPEHPGMCIFDPSYWPTDVSSELMLANSCVQVKSFQRTFTKGYPRFTSAYFESMLIFIIRIWNKFRLLMSGLPLTSVANISYCLLKNLPLLIKTLWTRCQSSLQHTVFEPTARRLPLHVHIDALNQSHHLFAAMYL
jgi:hypothetical protein